MSSLNIEIRPKINSKKFTVEIDFNKLEKLAASLGFFNPAFLNSLNRAEKEYRSGRIRRIDSLKELRKSD